jgi:hypothetical protein
VTTSDELGANARQVMIDIFLNKDAQQQHHCGAGLDAASAVPARPVSARAPPQ